MVLETQKIIDVACQLAEEKDLKVCFQKSALGGLLVGGAAMLGGVIMGPAGLAVGGTLGGIGSALFMQGEFKSAYTVINEMTPSQKEELADKLRNVLTSLDATDVMALTALLAQGSGNVRELLLKEIIGYLNSNISMQVIC